MAKNYNDLQKKLDNVLSNYQKENARLDQKIAGAKEKINTMSDELAKAEEIEDAAKFTKLTNELETQRNLIKICESKKAKLVAELGAQDGKAFVKAVSDRRNEIVKDYEDKARPLLKQIVKLAEDMEEANQEGENLILEWNSKVSETKGASIQTGYPHYSISRIIFDFMQDNHNHNLV